MAGTGDLDTDHTVPMDTDVGGVQHRWAMVNRRAPYWLLLVGTVISAATGDVVGMSPGEWYVAGVLVAAGLALQVSWGALDDALSGPSTLNAVFYMTRWVIGFALCWINPFFCFYAYAGYAAHRLLPRRLTFLGQLATSVTMAGAQSGGMPPQSTGQWLLFGAILTVTIVLVDVFSRQFAKEDERARVQAETIHELERTNTALQQALDENAALHAQLLVQAREAGVADERRRLAAEIHDTIAQGLTGIIAQLQVVAGTSDPDAARTHLERASELARHSLGEARRSVHNLAPTALAEAGLPEALRKTVASWGERTGVRAEFTVTGTAEELHEEVSATLLRIAEEALSNVARHARASRTGVTLSFMDGEVSLDIRDDGSGFDLRALPERSSTGGFGLDGMGARARRIAGSLAVEAEPGQGTAVSARVPLVRHDR
jgi:signal transduction histidine kinase